MASMQKVMICVITIFIILSVNSVLTAQSFKNDQLSVGDSSPTFYLRDINGDDFFLSDHVGEPRNGYNDQKRKKIVILSFFATWCVPCREELPELQSITESYSNESLLTLLIDVREKSKEVSVYLKLLRDDINQAFIKPLYS